MCNFHWKDRRGKLHRVHLPTLRVSLAALFAHVCVFVCTQSSVVTLSQWETIRSLNNGSNFLPVLLLFPHPTNHTAHSKFLYVCAAFLFMLCRSALFWWVAARWGHSVFVQWRHNVGKALERHQDACVDLCKKLCAMRFGYIREYIYAVMNC